MVKQQSSGDPAALRPNINPRDTWGADLPPGTLQAEEDVRFLLVHHTASSNNYQQGDVVGQIRSFHSFHTGADKGWPDIAYNFLIDRFGGIWEARAGSISGAVRGDATGGSQGYAILCCLIGDHAAEPPTPEAFASLVNLLAWLGATYGVDTSPGATVQFESRGSNKWATGTLVTTGTIAGHRDMSQTSCPGDHAYGLIQNALPDQVSSVRATNTQVTASDVADIVSTTSPTSTTQATGETTTESTTSSSTTSTEPPDTSTSTTSSTASSTSPSTSAAPTTESPNTTIDEQALEIAETSESNLPLALTAGAATGAAALGALIWLRTRREGEAAFESYDAPYQQSWQGHQPHRDPGLGESPLKDHNQPDESSWPPDNQHS